MAIGSKDIQALLGRYQSNVLGCIASASQYFVSR